MNVRCPEGSCNSVALDQQRYSSADQQTGMEMGAFTTTKYGAHRLDRATARYRIDTLRQCLCNVQKGRRHHILHHILPGLPPPRPTVETPRDFARRLLLRSHRALCTPSGSGSPDRSSYPSRLPSAYLPQNTRFKRNLPDRANTRRFVRAPVHDPRYVTDLRAFPGPKCSERKPLGENGKKI